jgi:hypothetical protein
MKPAVVLLNDGPDSAATLAIARVDGFEVLALPFRYCTRHGVARGLVLGGECAWNSNCDHPDALGQPRGGFGCCIPTLERFRVCHQMNALVERRTAC